MANVIHEARGKERRNPLAAGLDSLAEGLLFREALQQQRTKFELDKKTQELQLQQAEEQLKTQERIRKAREQFQQAHEESQPTEGTLPQQPMQSRQDTERNQDVRRLLEVFRDPEFQGLLTAYPELGKELLGGLGTTLEPTLGEIMGSQGAAAGGGERNGFAVSPLPQTRGMLPQQPGMGVHPIPLAGTQPSVGPIAPGGTQPSVAPIPAGPAGPAVAPPTGRIGELNQAIATRDAEIDKLEGVMLRLRPSDKAFKAVETRLKMEEAARERLVKVRDRLEARAAPTRTTQEIALAEFDKPFEELNQQQRATVRGIARREDLQKVREHGLETERFKEGIRADARLPGVLEEITGLKTVKEAEKAGYDLRALGEKRMDEFIDEYTFTTGAAELIEDMQLILQTNPESWATTGTMTSAAIGFIDQTSQAARFAGVELQSPEATARYARWLRDVAGDNIELQAQVLGLAFAAVAAETGGGKQMTDRKIELKIREIGANTRSPDLAGRRLESFKRQMDRRLQLKAKAVIGKEIPSILGKSKGAARGHRDARADLHKQIDAGKVNRASEAMAFLEEQGVPSFIAEQIVIDILQKKGK